MAGTAGNGPSVGAVQREQANRGLTLRYRILRYVPNLVRDEWVNVGVLLEEARGSRRAMRLIEQPGEFARVRRLHPDADEDLSAMRWPRISTRACAGRRRRWRLICRSSSRTFRTCCS